MNQSVGTTDTRTDQENPSLRQRDRLAVVLAAAVSLVLGTFTAVNQLIGLFSRISLGTVVASLVVSVALVVGGAVFLRRQTEQAEPSPRVPMRNLRLLSWVLAAVVALMATVPFVAKLTLAEAARRDGIAKYNRQLYASARGPLERAIRYREDIGLPGPSAATKVALVETYAELGDWERAHRLIGEIEDSNPSDDLRGRLLGARAGIEYGLGHFEQAELLYQQARQLIPKDSRPYAIVLANEAATWVERGGDHKQRARNQLGEARRLYERLGDELGVAYVLLSEGDLEQRPSDARRIHRQALQIAETHHDHGLAASLLQRIAITHRVEGDFQQARSVYEQALARFRLTASPLGQALIYANLATLGQAAGQDVAANKQIERSESFVRVIDPSDPAIQPRLVAELRTKQGDVHDALGDAKASERRYQEALELYSRHPEPLAEARTLVNYAGLLIHVGRTEEARNRLSQAREIVDAFSRGEPTPLLGVLETNLARIDQETGNAQSAFARHRKAAAIFAASEERLQEAQARENLAILGAQAGAVQEAIAVLDTVLPIYRELENRDLEANALYERYVLLEADVDRNAALRQLLDLLERYNIDQAAQTRILLGILPQEVGGRLELMVFRERLRQLNTFLAEGGPKADLGQSFLQLARISYLLEDNEGAMRFARKAEPYANAVPMPARSVFNWEVGRVLLDTGEPGAGLEHYWTAYDLEAGTQASAFPGRQYAKALLIEGVILDHWDSLDPSRQLAQARAALRHTEDQLARETLSGLVAYLQANLDA